MKMTIKKTDISLEWSFSQRCFHIEPVEYAIRTNISLFKNGGSCDYVLLGIFKDDKDASAAAQILRESRPDIFTHPDDLERIVGETEKEMSLEIDALLIEKENARDLSKRLEKAYEEIARLENKVERLEREIRLWRHVYRKPEAIDGRDTP